MPLGEGLTRPAARPGLKARLGPLGKRTMESRRPQIVRLAFLVAMVGAHVGVVQWAAPAPYLGVVPSVRLAAAVTLWAAAYAALVSAWVGRCALPPAVREVPDMSLRSVIVYIYGLGFVVFATVLATLGVSSSAALNFVCGMAAVCVCDTLERAHESWFRRAAIATAGVCAAVAVHLVASNEPHFNEYALAIEARDPTALAYALGIPLIAPLAFFLARRQSYCSPALVCELIGLAFPCAGLLSALVLCTLPPGPYPTGALLWSAAPLPFLGLPVLFFGVQTALLFSTVDFLCALGLALATKRFAATPDGPDALLALCFAGLAFLFRLCTCLHRDDVDGRAMCGADQKDAIQSPRSADGPAPECGHV